MLEKVDDRRELPPMGQAVGIQRDEDVGRYPKEANTGPPRDEGPRAAGLGGPGEHVDDATEQPGLHEEDARERNIGEGERTCEPLLRPEELEDAQVNPDQRHAGTLWSDRAVIVEPLPAGNTTLTADICEVPTDMIYGYLELNIIYIMRSTVEWSE